MKQFYQYQFKPQKGFALISTIVVTVLLLVVGLAMHSLSSITVKSVSVSAAQTEADANARLALMLAIAELQKTAGPDQRITADASILNDTAASPNAVGVWESWSPNIGENLQDSDSLQINYDVPKRDGFLRWLVSGNIDDLADSSWPIRQSGDFRLFGINSDGFALNGSLIDIEDAESNRIGRYAWAISQEGTKAKINVSGPELVDRDINDDIQVQPRPNLSLSSFFTQPTDLHDQRAARVIDLRQASLDEDLNGGDIAGGGAHFTTTSNGLLTNVVDGGLKVDMSLGFEMSDADFAEATWGDVVNPFNSQGETEFVTPNTYLGQRPLYEPLSDSGYFTYFRNWFRDVQARSGADANNAVQFDFPVASVPTFDTLRSFYRIPHHLYSVGGEVTAFERELDHIAAGEADLGDDEFARAGEGSLGFNYHRPPHRSVRGTRTQTNIRPILDRIMFVVSIALDSSDRVTLAMTPVVTLWNPYNVAIESEGLIAYPWLDLPWQFRLRGTSQGVLRNVGLNFFSSYIGVTGARQVDPYFIASMTESGSINTSANPDPIRFEPGEVRVFCPTSPDLVEFAVGTTFPSNTAVLPRARTIEMQPVDDIGDFNVTGGFVFRSNNNFQMFPNDEVFLDFRVSLRNNFPLPYMVALADTNILDTNSWDKGDSVRGGANDDRGQVLSNIVAQNFNQDNAEDVLDIESSLVSFEQLQAAPLPVVSLEVYHRVANPATANNSSADLVFSANPRQSAMNPYITNTDFKSGTQYDIRMRELSSVDDLLQVDAFGDNVNAYYGESQSSGSGRTNLSFFELPQEPLLSLGDFQHADLAYTPYASANQFGNSWASAYVPIDGVVDDGPDFDFEVDHTYLTNEAIWDGFFFSGAAPDLDPATNPGVRASIWDNGSIANEVTSLEDVLTALVDDQEPLRNPRMKLLPLDGLDGAEFAEAMMEPEGCTEIASHLMVDGAFNVNSTSVEAWTAMLLSLRGTEFDLVDGTTASIGDETPFPRFRDPIGTEDDNWQGFRSLSDDEVTELAENIVEQVKERGPFLSMSEFINRRIEDSELGFSGAIQTAIDDTNINDPALQTPLVLDEYEDEDDHLSSLDIDTGTGIPGYLTQADVLKSIAPVITVRSDTFTIRTYGEARDAKDEVVATAWVEAVVQRYPEFTDDTDLPSTLTDDLSTINQQFGRAFRIVSFRYMANNEAVAIMSDNSDN